MLSAQDTTNRYLAAYNRKMQMSIQPRPAEELRDPNLKVFGWIVCLGTVCLLPTLWTLMMNLPAFAEGFLAGMFTAALFGIGGFMVLLSMASSTMSQSLERHQ